MGNTFFEKVKWAFIFWLARRLPDCKSMVKTLGETLDRQLSLREKILANLHLFTCEACELYLKQVRFLREAAHAHEERLADEFAGRELSAAARERLKGAVRSAGGFVF